MNNYEIESVAKIGGSSMADPLVPVEQLAYPGNEASIVVVSAPGINLAIGHDHKLTNILESFSKRLTPSHEESEFIQSQVADIADQFDPDHRNSDIQVVVDGVISDMVRWERDGYPIMGLGENWSARLFAAHTGREFVDARHVIRFDREGNVDSEATYSAITRELTNGGNYVVPGFYGSDNEGRIRLLDRGGSDTTGALIAAALHAGTYQVWSDVPGFLTANPGQVPHSQLNEEVTRREAREMYIGCEVLHRDVLRFLGATAIPIHMRNTFDVPNAPGTIVRAERNWSARPIVGVVGTSNLAELALKEFGMNEQVGSTTDVFNILRDRGVSYEHAATSTDELSIVFRREYQYQLPLHLQGLRRPDRRANVQPIGIVRIVGEGLANSGVLRSRTLGRIAAAFADNDIGIFGMTDVPHSATLTFFVEDDPASVARAIRVAHRTVFEV